MTYLLDTYVLSEFRRARTGRCDPSVARWAGRVEPATMFISALTIYELERGARLIARRDEKQGADLLDWVRRQVREAFRDRILPVDVDVATRCALISVPNPRPLPDALIAATALTYGFAVVTRNIAHFRPMGVTLINPWDR